MWCKEVGIIWCSSWKHGDDSGGDDCCCEEMTVVRGDARVNSSEW